MTDRITIIANGDSFWTQRYIKNVSLPLGHRVSLVTASNNKYKEYYERNQVNTIITRPSSIHLCHRLDALLTSINTVKAVRRTKPDLVVVHYAYTYILRILPIIQKKVKTIICYWGSDILRANETELLSIKESVNRADRIVTVTSDLKNRLIEVYGDRIKAKTSVIDMGISAFDAIDKKRDYRVECKNRIVGKENSEKHIVTIGYNAGKAQQHERVIMSLNALSQDIKDRICIVLPMTYQRDDTAYLERVEKLSKGIGVSSVVLSSFLDDEGIADLCLATDVFINAQITDALSSSMIEQIYSGSIVINGKWLQYSFLEENNIKCLQFSDFDDLISKVQYAINIDDLDSNILAKQSSILRQKVSWSASREKWKQVYDSLQ